MDPAPDTRMPSCKGVDIEDASISQLQWWLQEGKFTSTDLVECYLERTKRLNHVLRAVIELNPDVLSIARERDDERTRGVVRGPLHGIPFLVKDNIATRDKMQTTAGSTMLVGSVVPEDAQVVKLLREAGAVLLGHANMSEWASMRATYYSEAYSSRGGQGRNPYNLAENPGGSSSGPATAVASNMCAFSLGTETDSSVILPADLNGVVGMKPTVGLVSSDGVIPESHNLDTVGAFGRSVADTATVLDVLCQRPGEFISHIEGIEGLSGARFGMPWERIWEFASCTKSAETQYRILQALIDRLRASGAEVINVEIPSAAGLVPIGNKWDWDYPSKIGHPEHSEFTVVKVDFYNDIKKYLAGLVVNPQNIRSLEDIIEYNIKHNREEGGVAGTHPAWPTGQDSFEKSQASKGIEDETYKSALDYIRRKTRDEGIDAALKYNGEPLDGLIVPVQADNGVAMQMAAQAGYPMITVPVDVGDDGVPFGLAIIQTAFKDDKLFKYGAAIEAAIGGRPRPSFRNIHANNWIYVGVLP
ncbi:putative amidase [Rosellinia necatrix]|uniref:Putative amidase n=1 Tax=Rosellinia necatrix TaxID=77044 RepID=A0A1S7UIW8_ROSNE|nr:putative amidase [Rosellinia necatrix]